MMVSKKTFFLMSNNIYKQRNGFVPPAYLVENVLDEQKPSNYKTIIRRQETLKIQINDF